MPSIHDIPGNFVAQHAIPAHAAATATEKVNIFRAPFACKIVSVEVIPDAAATGDNTNSTHVNLLNAGTAGTGTTELGALDYATGTDAAVGVAQDVYRPASPLAIASGVILQAQLEKVSSGLALGRMLCVVTYQAN